MPDRTASHRQELLSPPAKILVLYVVTGVVLGGAGVYQKLVDWAGSGATVPLTGFGYLLAKGVRKAVEEQGFLGALTGGVTAAAGGITAAIFFGFLVARSSSPSPRADSPALGALLLRAGFFWLFLHLCATLGTR